MFFLSLPLYKKILQYLTNNGLRKQNISVKGYNRPNGLVRVYPFF